MALSPIPASSAFSREKSPRTAAWTAGCCGPKPRAPTKPRAMSSPASPVFSQTTGCGAAGVSEAVWAAGVVGLAGTAGAAAAVAAGAAWAAAGAVGAVTSAAAVSLIVVFLLEVQQEQARRPCLVAVQPVPRNRLPGGSAPLQGRGGFAASSGTGASVGEGL